MQYASRFPSDLVRQVVSNVPLRPRLLVCALVCKRWHKEVLASVTSLPWLSVGPLSSALKSYPNVTTVHLDMCSAYKSRVTFPPTIRRLELKTNWKFLPSFVFSSLVSLECLSVGSLTFCRKGCALLSWTQLTTITSGQDVENTLIEKNFNTLTRLDYYAVQADQLPDRAMCTKLTALRSLSMKWKGYSHQPVQCAMVAACALSLTSLTLDGALTESVRGVPQFPCALDLDTKLIVDLLEACPVLTDLALSLQFVNNDAAPITFWRTVAPFLTKLSCTRDLAEELRALTRLCELDVPVHRDGGKRALLPYLIVGTRLRSLSLLNYDSEADEGWDALEDIVLTCTSLTELDVWEADLLATWRLPQLTSLQVRGEVPAEHFEAFMDALRTNAPRLRSLRVGFISDITTVKPIEDALRKAELAGLEEFHISEECDYAPEYEQMYFLLTACVPRLQWLRLSLPQPEHDVCEYIDPGPYWWDDE